MKSTLTAKELTREVIILSTIVGLQKSVIKRWKTRVGRDDPSKYAYLEEKANYLMEEIDYEEIRRLVGKRNL